MGLSFIQRQTINCHTNLISFAVNLNRKDNYPIKSCKTIKRLNYLEEAAEGELALKHDGVVTALD